VPLLRVSPTFVAFIVASAFFMENLDGAAITIVLPQIAHTFAITPTAASLGITVYMISQAIFIAVSSWAADRFGPRDVFCWAIGVFIIASAVCGLAPDFSVFVVARIVQGAAAALMSPVGRVIVLRTAPKGELMRAFGITIWPGLIAPIVGQPIGGLIATYLSWQWIFFLNLPIGLVGIALLIACVANRREDHKRELDVGGFVLAAASLSALLYALDRLAHDIDGWPVASGLVLGGLALGGLAIRRSRAHPSPLVDISLAKIRTFSFTSITGGTPFRIAMGAAPFLLPLLFEIGFGMSPFDASLLMLAYAGANLAMKAVTTAILRRYGFRQVLLVNGCITVLSVFLFAAMVPGVPIWLIVAILAVAGATRSLQFTALSTLAFADVPQAAMSGASTVQSMMQQIAFAFGIALGAVILSLSAAARGAASASVADFQVAFLISTLLIAASMPWLFRLAHDAGAEVSGHAARR
jgi:EmrB/QacA subfamily drug resistance transporter